MNRIVASLLMALLLSGCGRIFGEHGECDAFCKEDRAVVALMILIPFARCAHPQGYKMQWSNGSVDCVTPATVPYIYNQSTTAYAGTTVTGVVTLECRAGSIRTWGKIGMSNPPVGSTASFVQSGSINLASYSVGDSIFCLDTSSATFHKVTIL